MPTLQSTIISNLHSKEQSEKISVHLRFDAAQHLIHNTISFIKEIQIGFLSFSLLYLLICYYYYLDKYNIFIQIAIVR